MQESVFSKKIQSSANFDLLSKLETFPDFRQKISIHVKKKTNFYEKISFDTHSTPNLPALPILKKTIVVFSKKTQILNVLRNLTISVVVVLAFAGLIGRKGIRV